jgi:hypothetical protein
MIKKIKDIAIIISKEFRLGEKGIRFITEPDSIQQVGIMNWEKGHDIIRHYHCLQPRRKAIYTQEVILVRSGKIQVDLYGLHEKFVESVILKKGDIICLLSGGHGITMLEDSELLEIKQGPYTARSDKVRF